MGSGIPGSRLGSRGHPTPGRARPGARTSRTHPEHDPGQQGHEHGVHPGEPGRGEHGSGLAAGKGEIIVLATRGSCPPSHAVRRHTPRPGFVRSPSTGEGAIVLLGLLARIYCTWARRLLVAGKCRNDARAMSMPANPPRRRWTPTRSQPAAGALDRSAWSPASLLVVDAAATSAAAAFSGCRVRPRRWRRWPCAPRGLVRLFRALH